uniref:Uncharacterized protein n=1 Tax=viral metagenome TaxID=1070528 RepID=A0A6M3JFQ5_9ZZZZ
MKMVGDKDNIKARHDWEEEMKIRAEGIGDSEYEAQKELGNNGEEPKDYNPEDTREER